jgi:hypothetical protein
VVVILVALLGAVRAVSAAEQDLALWSLASVNHEFNEHWSASFQTELRLDQDISAFQELVLKPAGYYRFNDWAQLGIGYKYIDKNHAPNEHDAWQEIYLRHSLASLGFTQQIRIEERFIEEISGVIPRLRYLIHGTAPISPKFYFSGSGAARFNLSDKGEGPVYGFEQSRLYAGVGYKAGKYARVELGYLWRYELERRGPDKSDHVIRIQFLFDTTGYHPSHSGS